MLAAEKGNTDSYTDPTELHVQVHTASREGISGNTAGGWGGGWNQCLSPGGHTAFESEEFTSDL